MFRHAWWRSGFVLGLALLAGCEAVPPLAPAFVADPPYAAFSFAPSAPQPGQTVRFEAADGLVPEGTARPERFEWDFGDANRASGPRVAHAYAGAGAYAVTLTVTGADGQTAETVQTVGVAAPPPPPAEFPYTFGAGVQRVGVDVEPGTYRTRAPGAECYWERLSGLGGFEDEIIAREFNEGPAIVKIAGGDRGFNSQGCARWTKDLSPLTEDPYAPFGPGVYQVGAEVAPGVWVSEDTGRCYWKRLAAFTWEPGDVLDEGFSRDTPVAVLIEPGDAGFASSECGTWKRFDPVL